MTNTERQMEILAELKRYRSCPKSFLNRYFVKKRIKRLRQELSDLMIEELYSRIK